MENGNFHSSFVWFLNFFIKNSVGSGKWILANFILRTFWERLWSPNGSDYTSYKSSINRDVKWYADILSFSRITWILLTTLLMRLAVDIFNTINKLYFNIVYIYIKNMCMEKMYWPNANAKIGLQNFVSAISILRMHHVLEGLLKPMWTK